MNIFVKDENERLIVNEDIVNRLQEIESQKSKLADEETNIRNAILEGMIENNIEKCTTKNFTFTQVIPKNIEIFDKDAFLMNENDDVISCFTGFSEIVTFDEAKFKTEHPEMYEKYSTVKVEAEVDVKKLQKTLKPIYDKYCHIQESNKRISLRIVKKAE